MKVVPRWIFALLLLLASLYIAYFNPGRVTLYLAPARSYRVPVMAYEHQDFWVNPYLCQVCGYPASQWSGRCPSCLRWGTLQLALLAGAKKSIEGETPHPRDYEVKRWPQDSGCLFEENVLKE